MHETRSWRFACGAQRFGFERLGAPASIWRWCSGVSLSAQVLIFVYMRNPRRRSFTRADMQTVNKFLFYGIGSISTVAVALQAINFGVWNRFWPHIRSTPRGPRAICPHGSPAATRVQRPLTTLQPLM